MTRGPAYLRSSSTRHRSRDIRTDFCPPAHAGTMGDAVRSVVDQQLGDYTHAARMRRGMKRRGQPECEVGLHAAIVGDVVASSSAARDLERPEQPDRVHAEIGGV